MLRRILPSQRRLDGAFPAALRLANRHAMPASPEPHDRWTIDTRRPRHSLAPVLRSSMRSHSVRRGATLKQLNNFTPDPHAFTLIPAEIAGSSDILCRAEAWT